HVDPAERANKWVVLTLSGTATFMTTLDSSIVNIGLPSIAHAFGVPLSGNIEWVLIGYLVVIAAVLLTFGRLADMLGRKPLFLAGAALLATGLAALTLGLSFGQEWGWSSLRFLGSMGIAVAALAGAACVERRVHAPILDPALVSKRVFAFANVSFMICMLALFAVSFLLPFYLEELHGFDTLRSGLLLTPLPLTLAMVAPVSGALADRVGSRWLAPLGLAIAWAGLLPLSGLTQASSIAYLVLCLIVTAIG